MSKPSRVFGIQYNDFKLDEVTTQPLGIEQVQLLRVGTFKHAVFGEFKITKETLISLAENFNRGVRRVDLAVDYFHESKGVAAGWIKRVELREDNSELWIEVDWTKTGAKKLMEKELRYISADFDFNYTDMETGISYGPTLLGAGLTNRPHIKEMRAILSEVSKDISDKIINLEENKPSNMDIEQVLAVIKELDADAMAQIYEFLSTKIPEQISSEVKTEENTKKEDLKMSEKTIEVQLAELKTAHDKLLADIKVLKEENVNLKAESAKAKKESDFNVMLSEGKVVEAQREHFMSGDMVKFAQNAKVLNLHEEGTGKGKKEEPLEGVTRESAEVKLSEIAEKISKDENLDYGAAMSLAMERNPKLAEVCE